MGYLLKADAATAQFDTTALENAIAGLAADVQNQTAAQATHNANLIAEADDVQAKLDAGQITRVEAKDQLMAIASSMAGFRTENSAALAALQLEVANMSDEAAIAKVQELRDDLAAFETNRAADAATALAEYQSIGGKIDTTNNTLTVGNSTLADILVQVTSSAGSLTGFRTESSANFAALQSAVTAAVNSASASEQSILNTIAATLQSEAKGLKKDRILIDAGAEEKTVVISTGHRMVQGRIPAGSNAVMTMVDENGNDLGTPVGWQPNNELTNDGSDYNTYEEERFKVAGGSVFIEVIWQDDQTITQLDEAGLPQPIRVISAVPVTYNSLSVTGSDPWSGDYNIDAGVNADGRVIVSNGARWITQDNSSGYWRVYSTLASATALDLNGSDYYVANPNSGAAIDPTLANAHLRSAATGVASGHDTTPLPYTG